MEDNIINKVINNVIIDIDLIFNKEMAWYSKMNSLNKINKSKCGSLVEFIYNRQYNDTDANPLESIGINDEFKDFDFHQHDESLYDHICINDRIMDLLFEYCQNEYINVTIACNSKTDIELLNSINFIKGNAKFILKKNNPGINIEPYDTLYFPNYSYLKQYNFKEDTHRKSIFISNSRCNFIDDDMTTLRFEYLFIGLKNDIYIANIYNIEVIDNLEEGIDTDGEV